MQYSFQHTNHFTDLKQINKKLQCTQKEIHLRPFGNYVIDRKHKPQAKFCPGFPKVTNISREPVNNIFQWKEGVSPADQLFSVTLKGYLDNSAVESDLCTYKVKLKGAFLVLNI